MAGRHRRLPCCQIVLFPMKGWEDELETRSVSRCLFCALWKLPCQPSSSIAMANALLVWFGSTQIKTFILPAGRFCQFWSNRIIKGKVMNQRRSYIEKKTSFCRCWSSFPRWQFNRLEAGKVVPFASNSTNYLFDIRGPSVGSLN